MSSELALPRFVALGANSKYMRWVNEDGSLRGFLQFSADQILKTQYTKFALDFPNTDEVGLNLVHIRCCYNNKYLVKSSPAESWIVGTANEPEEDKSKWSCTLFKISAVTNGYTFSHVASGLNVGLSSNTSYLNCLQIQSTSKVIEFVDTDTLVTLPKYVGFIDDRDKHLRAHWLQNHEYNEFMGDTIEIKEARYEVFPLYDGRVRLKSLYWNKFWRRSPDWIWADSTDTTANNKDTVFFPIRVAGNIIALRNLGNNKFCKGVSKEYKSNCLNADTTEISKGAQLKVVDAVKSRKIDNITFQLKDARTYNMTTVESVTKEVINRTNQDTPGEVSFSYTEARSKSWDKSNSWSVGVSVTMESGVPLLGKVEIEISGEYSGQYSWGESQETSQETTATEKVITKAMSKSVVTMLVQRGTIDVPFSYSQYDTLFDGTTENTRETDGIYTSMNTYVKIDVSDVPLAKAEI